MKIYFPIDLSKTAQSRMANVGTGKILETNTWKEGNAVNDFVSRWDLSSPTRFLAVKV